MKKIILLVFAILFVTPLTSFGQAQRTGAGIGIYPTGTETGFGYRSSRDKRWAIDARVTRANFFTKPSSGSFVNEASFIYRVAYYEKIRFHIGLGGRADWNMNENQSHRFGLVTPLGVEAFPFPFQNAGLFFEAAPFFTWANHGHANIGVRTVAGIAFYFIRKKGIGE